MIARRVAAGATLWGPWLAPPPLPLATAALGVVDGSRRGLAQPSQRATRSQIQLRRQLRAA
eukprot:8722418-Lingulodinium_polyedra.AAC.1